MQAAAWGPEAQTAKDFDTQITLLRFANGVFGTIENSRRCAFGWAGGGGCHGRWGRHAASDSCLSIPCGVVVVVCRYDQRVELFGEKGALQGNNRAPNTVVRSDSTGVVACRSVGRERASRGLEKAHPPPSGQALTGLTEHDVGLLLPVRMFAALPFSFFMDRYSEAYVEAVKAFVGSIGGKPSNYLATAQDGKVGRGRATINHSLHA